MKSEVFVEQAIKIDKNRLIVDHLSLFFAQIFLKIFATKDE